MKIGILTYHRAENYGALLQAYALKTYLGKYTNDVCFVDYWPDYHLDHYKIFSWNKFMDKSFRNKCMYLIHIILWGGFKYLRKYKLCRFMEKHLGIGKVIKYRKDTDICNEYDCVVYGSDQIWRKQNVACEKKYNLWYFGSGNVSAPCKIAYAASMGHIETNFDDEELLKKEFRNFNTISVRELDLQQFLSKLDIPSILVIDPVFLLTKEEWRNISEKKNRSNRGKYILFYNLLNTPESRNFVIRLQKETNLPIREINMKLDFSHLKSGTIKSASIEQFLGLIDNAEYVISNSFHGVAFSIIFEKQFYAVGMRERSSRVRSLLNSANIEKRYVDDNPTASLTDCINYKNVNAKINELVNISQNYFNEVFSHEKK